MTEDLHAEYYRLVEQSKQINKQIAELDVKLHERAEPGSFYKIMNKNVDILGEITETVVDFSKRIPKLEHNFLKLELVCCQIRSFLFDNVVKRILRLEKQAGIEENLEGGDKEQLQAWISLFLGCDFPREELKGKETGSEELKGKETESTPKSRSPRKKGKNHSALSDSR